MILEEYDFTFLYVDILVWIYKEAYALQIIEGY